MCKMHDVRVMVLRTHTKTWSTGPARPGGATSSSRGACDIQRPSGLPSPKAQSQPTRAKGAPRRISTSEGLVNPSKRSPLLASQWLHRFRVLFRMTLSFF